MSKKTLFHRIILASGSATRAKLLQDAGIPFTPCVPVVDESSLRATLVASQEKVDAIALKLAGAKALNVAQKYPQDIVIGSDQVLFFDGSVLGKCTSLADATEQLKEMRGKTHQLVTAVVLACGNDIVWQHSEVCTMHMRPFSDTFLEKYIAGEGEKILSAVGCYFFEGRGLQLFEKTDADYFSILGLPLLSLLNALRDLKVTEQ